MAEQGQSAVTDMDYDDCLSCGAGEPFESEVCPKSKRPCRHHCNHSWTHDVCDWCNAEWGEDGIVTPANVNSEVGKQGG